MNFLKRSLIFSLSVVVFVSSASCCYGVKGKKGRRKKSGAKHSTHGKIVEPVSYVKKALASANPQICLSTEEDVEEFVKLLQENKGSKPISISIGKTAFSCNEGLFDRFIDVLKRNDNINEVNVFSGVTLEKEKTNYKELIAALKSCTHVTQISLLDFSDVIHDGLEYLTFDRAKNGDFDKLLDAFKKNKSIKVLNFFGDQDTIIPNELFDIGSCAINNISTLNCLSVSGYNMSGGNILRLSEALKNNKTIKTLDLSYCSLDDKAVEVLADVLKYNTTIESLDLSNNYITSKGNNILEGVIKARPKECKLNVFNNLILSQEDLKRMQNMIKNKEIVFDENMYESEGVMKFLIDAVKDGKVDTVFFSDDCDAFELNFMSEVANQNLKVREVVVSDCEAIDYICNLVLKNTHVEVLNYCDSVLQDSDVCILADALRKNTNIVELYLLNNCIGEEGAQSLIDLLQVNTTLTEIDVSANDPGEQVEKITSVSLKTIAEALDLNKLRKDVKSAQDLKDDAIYPYIEVVRSLKDDVSTLQFEILDYDGRKRQVDKIVEQVKSLEGFKTTLLDRLRALFQEYIYYKRKLKFLSEKYYSKRADKKIIEKIYSDTLDEIEAFKLKSKRFSIALKAIKVEFADMKKLWANVNDVSTFQGYFNLFGNIGSLISYCNNETFCCDYTVFDTNIEVNRDEIELSAEDIAEVEKQKKEWEAQIERASYVDIFNIYDEEMRKNKFDSLFNKLDSGKDLRSLLLIDRNKYIWVKQVFLPVFNCLRTHKEYCDGTTKKRLLSYEKKMKAFFSADEKVALQDVDQVSIYLKNIDLVHRISKFMEVSNDFDSYCKFLGYWAQREKVLDQNPSLKLKMMIANLHLYDEFVKHFGDEYPDLEELRKQAIKSISISLIVLDRFKNKSEDEIRESHASFNTDTARKNIRVLLDTYKAKLAEQARLAQISETFNTKEEVAVAKSPIEVVSVDEESAKSTVEESTPSLKKVSKRKNKKAKTGCPEQESTDKIPTSEDLLKEVQSEFDVLKTKIEGYQKDFEVLAQKHIEYSGRGYLRVNKSGQVEEFAKRRDISDRMERFRELFKNVGLSKDTDIEIMKSSVILLECLERNIRSVLNELESLLTTAENFMEKKFTSEVVKSSSSPKVEEKEKKASGKALEIDSITVCFPSGKIQLDYEEHISDIEKEKDFVYKIIRWLRSESSTDLEPITSVKKPYMSCRFSDSVRVCFRFDEDFRNTHRIHITCVENNHNYGKINRKCAGG